MLFGVKQIKRCGLTRRSTGPIAAGRHLGYKSLAQIPARRNRPVSLYVRPHSSQTVDHHFRRSQNSRSDLFCQHCKSQNERMAKACRSCILKNGTLGIGTSVKSLPPISRNPLPSNYEIGFFGNFQKVIPGRGWRFAPACCAAQSVIRRGPYCSVPPHRLA